MGADKEDEVVQGPSGREERICVSVRLRPLNGKEIARNDVSDWECINDDTIIFRNSLSVAERSLYPTTYTFDRVFRNDCSTRQVYEEGAKEVALSVLRGINSSIFAYGQTSSGKTFTMSGITEYTIADIYDYIERHKEREFVLKFSAMEIYNESVRDLLIADTTPLRLLDDPEKGTIVEKLTEETLTDWNHFKELLSVCEAQRQIGETGLNETSSRSHQILRLTIENSAREFLGNGNSSTLIATVNFVDLAGSERASQSLSAGTRLKEGCHINRSLLTLGTVIRKLSKGRTGHVPFRDSKLTRILQSSLSDNARTSIICTLSPARSHVEQSRNTLLFACCAKEVTTNAQVNVVMSDKALVKHLQKELARLESELRRPGPTSITSASATLLALLREKDLQIEKLKEEVLELTRQRDLALSQVEDLQPVVGNESDDRISVIWADPDQHYPKLRVRNSWGSEDQISETAVLPDPCSLVVGDFGTSQYSGGHSRSDSDESFIQLPDLKVNFRLGDTPPQLSTNIPIFVDTDLCQETEEQTNDNLEDLYKDVRCIEMEESSMNRNVNSNVLSPVQNTGKEDEELGLPTSKEDRELGIGLENGDRGRSPPLKENIELGLEVESGDGGDQELGPPQLKEDKILRIGTENGDREYQGLGSHPLKEDKELSSVHSKFVIPFPSPEIQSPWMLENNMSSPRSLKFTRSRSCKADIMSSSSSNWFKTEEKNQSTPPIWFEKNLTGRPRGWQRKFSALKYGADNDRLSIDSSQTLGDAAVDELEAQDVKISSDERSSSTSTSTFVAGNKEMASLQYSTQIADYEYKELETEQNPSVSVKDVKDVGLDPIIDDLESPSNWPSEFKRLQREIIDLWHACNVSLVHRTYFFLLFKGDPKDSIYMEVELRRLSFLRDTFARGNQTVENGRTLTLALSTRALRHERQMLSMQMQKRFSEQYRDNLFLKWGIRLNSKNRRLQLAHCLWTDTKDLEHITESAKIVAKLVDIVEPDKAFREMFGLNFTPRRTSKALYMWNKSLKAFL